MATLFLFIPGCSCEHKACTVTRGPAIMKGEAALVLLLAQTCFSLRCENANGVLLCRNISSDFDPGYQTLIIFQDNVGEIGSSVLQNGNLVSITCLRINKAGITGIAEHAFSSFSHLTNLSLEHNLLRQINTNWFANPAILRELKLTSNLVEVINEFTVKTLTNLTNLTLNNNRIRHVHPQSFSSQSLLAELDLSENRLTNVSPEVFRSLRSLRSIRLHKNPWDCSCDHKDFVASIKELQSKAKLYEPLNVTCETPPPLKGRPVWDVSVCPVPHPSAMPTHPASGPTYTAALSAMQTSVLKQPTDAPTTPASSGTFRTPSLSGTDTSIHPKLTCTPVTPSVTAGAHDRNLVSTLIAAIATLCVLLFAVCFLAVLHRRKRSNKTVIPRCPEEEKKKKLEEDISSANDLSTECSDHRDPEMAWKKSLSEVRAKSANAVILTSPFGSSEKNKVTFQTEAPSESSEKPGDRKQTLELEGEAVTAGGGGTQMENQVTTDTVKEYEKREDDDKNLFEKPECVYVNTDTVPYLSIGTNQNDPSPVEDSPQEPSSKAQRTKVMRRISTWPPTAAQWQARCKMKESEEEDGEGITVWTQSEALKLSDEVEKITNKRNPPESCERCEKKKETEQNPPEAHVDLQDSLILTDSNTELERGELGKDPTTVRHTRIKISPNKEQKSAENPPNKRSSSKTEVRSDLKRAATSRLKTEGRAAGSKGPSGGASPDDETLLSGNEYAFMDLLHEVVQNNGRWTRERWKQIHVKKQRR